MQIALYCVFLSYSVRKKKHSRSNTVRVQKSNRTNDLKVLTLRFVSQQDQKKNRFISFKLFKYYTSLSENTSKILVNLQKETSNSSHYFTPKQITIVLILTTVLIVAGGTLPPVLINVLNKSDVSSEFSYLLLTI